MTQNVIAWQAKVNVVVTCMAGLLYKVNKAATLGYIGLACTDQACAWNSSTSQNVLPDTVENIRAQDNSTNKSTFIETTVFDTDEDLMEHLQSPEMAGLALIPGTILNLLLTAKPVEQPSVTNLAREHNNCEQQQCELCNEVYENHARCILEQRQKLMGMRATADQSSSLWLEQR